jgi:hypothetical protein
MYLYNEMIKYKASKIIITVKRQHTLQMVAVYQQWKRKIKNKKKTVPQKGGTVPLRLRYLFTRCTSLGLLFLDFQV